MSVGKTDKLYRAHPYHTKVPHSGHRAVDPALHQAGRRGTRRFLRLRHDGCRRAVVRDGARSRTEKEVEAELAGGKAAKRRSGGRGGSFLGDLSPVSDVHRRQLQHALQRGRVRRGGADRFWTKWRRRSGGCTRRIHTDGKTKGRINYTVWSEVFSCPGMRWARWCSRGRLWTCGPSAWRPGVPVSALRYMLVTKRELDSAAQATRIDPVSGSEILGTRDASRC